MKKVNARKLLMWWDEEEQLAEEFTTFARDYIEKAGDYNYVSNFADAMRDSGRYTVPNHADIESLLNHAGLKTVFDGRTTIITL